MPTISSTPVPVPRGVIRVEVPASVAFNLGKMTKVTADILGKLGHPECHSGFDIRFDIVRHYAVDEKLNVREVPTPIGGIALASGGVITEG